MLRVETKNAKPGMKLALPVQVPNSPSKLLLRVGYELKVKTLVRLGELGIRSLWVGYPSLSFMGNIVNADTVRTQSVIAGQITSTFEAVQEQATAKLPYHLYMRALSKMVSQLISHPESAIFLGDISDAGNDLMRHSSSVTYLSLLMGLKLEGYLVRERHHVDPARAAEVVNLGLGAMMHDIGLTLLPAAIRERYEETGDETDPAWQEHTTLGYKLVRGKINPTAASIVLHHHQHYDGTGFVGEDYPRMCGKRLHVFSRIVTVADQFDRLRNPPCRPIMPTAWALRSMLEAPLIHRYDPEVLDALLEVVPPYAPGMVVMLSNGRHAVVIDHHPQQPCRPIVQFIPDPKDFDSGDLPLGNIIDLSTISKRLFVVQCDGFDVADLNFDRPTLLPQPGDPFRARSA